MNPLQRTIKEVIETDLIVHNPHIMHSNGKKLFQLVKHVTGKAVSDHTDYEVNPWESPDGSDSYILCGRRGYIRVTLAPLFQVEE